MIEADLERRAHESAEQYRALGAPFGLENDIARLAMSRMDRSDA
jgi:hypothetical protein